MESIQQYLSDIREHGDLRRTEAQKLTDRLRTIFDKVGGALHDAGVWGDEMEYVLRKETRKGEYDKWTVLRPSLESYHPDPASPGTTDVVVIKAQAVEMGGYGEASRTTTASITALPIEEDRKRKTVYFYPHKTEGGKPKVKNVDVIGDEPGWTNEFSDEERQKRVVSRAQSHLGGEWDVMDAGISSYPNSSDDKLYARLRRWKQEVPFVPRRLAVEIAEELPGILDTYAGYVKELAVTTKEARQVTENVAVA